MDFIYSTDSTVRVREPTSVSGMARVMQRGGADAGGAIPHWAKAVYRAFKLTMKYMLKDQRETNTEKRGIWKKKR